MYRKKYRYGQSDVTKRVSIPSGFIDKLKQSWRLLFQYSFMPYKRRQKLALQLSISMTRKTIFVKYFPLHSVRFLLQSDRLPTLLRPTIMHQYNCDVLREYE